jgi:hypothetical protein
MRHPNRTPIAASLIVTALLGGCSSRPDDPTLGMLQKALRQEDRLVLLRVLDVGTGDRIALVVTPAKGRPELRIYERAGNGPFTLVHTAQQGDAFNNLSIEDVNADGRDDLLASWTAGHLETLEVLTRGEDGRYQSLFLNAGREIERRYDQAGRLEFWITSRTYDEGPAQPPRYATTVYRWDGARFSEPKPR